MSLDHKIWSNHYWNRLEWTQEMLFNTDHHITMHPDQKIEFDEFFFQISFLLPISLRISLRRFLEGFFQLISFWKRIFFKKLISISRLLKTSLWQMKPTLSRYFWTKFHYGNLDLGPGTLKTRFERGGSEFIGQLPEEIPTIV